MPGLGGIRICTAWKRTGRMRVVPGWFGIRLEIEKSQRLGITYAPGHTNWTGEDRRWFKAELSDFDFSQPIEGIANVQVD